MALLGDALSFGRRKNAEHATNRANRAKRKLAVLSTIQNRRNFIRQARGVQADVLLGGAQNVGGLDSSGFQGTQASVQTQFFDELQRSKDTQKANKGIEAELDTAARNLSAAATLQFAGDAVQTIVSGT